MGASKRTRTVGERISDTRPDKRRVSITIPYEIKQQRILLWVAKEIMNMIDDPFRPSKEDRRKLKMALRHIHAVIDNNPRIPEYDAVFVKVRPTIEET